MPRQNRLVDGLIPGSCKIRKRGCSPTSSTTSSVLQNYKFKRAILASTGQRSRSGTPVPSWRNASAPEEAAPSRSGGGRAAVSARKLAATLWEMNEVPSPKVGERLEEEEENTRENVKKKSEMMRVRERVGARSTHSGSGSLPPHLSDPSHSPVSEIETRSRGQTPSGSMVGDMPRLKDISNALTTSKELLKIINRVWSRDDQPSSSLSLISALHAELERARLLVNQLIQEQRLEENEINCLVKCFAEEKVAWKNKEKQVVEAAIESVAGELEVERKLRRRFESLNKKLGNELAETKSSLLKAVNELESEKRARGIMEQICDDIARDIGDDKDEVQKMKRESVRINEEVENDRETLHIADKLKEERAQMKLLEAKNKFEEKNTIVDKLRNQLEAFMKRGKQKGCLSPIPSRGNDDNNGDYLRGTHFVTHESDIKEGYGEVEDGVGSEEESDVSDTRSVDLNTANNSKTCKGKSSSNGNHYSRRVLIDDETEGQILRSGRGSRISTFLQRSISDGVESIQNIGIGLDRERLYELEKQAQRRSCEDDIMRYKTVKCLRDQILASSRVGPLREDYGSPTRQWRQAWPSRDPCNTIQEKPTTLQGSGLTSRLAESRGEGQSVRRSKK
ncbi:uncharacterized protein At5g41620 isoform X2 [Rhododendron vialii]|uniref:uncharacterized protein At5g41620 isoform X2 n=1 Tax=Rhododendron vialii TaxID=182163 RepID=UPI00265E3D60|nr:uncharacterized protein At5g41620 isoform X2 [Rhododendron vialii]